VKVLYRQTASDDIVRQFRYYLVTAEAPEIALRFREAVRRTIQSLRQNPHVGPRHSSSNPRIQNLRSWPVTGFEAIPVMPENLPLPGQPLGGLGSELKCPHGLVPSVQAGTQNSFGPQERMSREVELRNQIEHVSVESVWRSHKRKKYTFEVTHFLRNRHHLTPMKGTSMEEDRQPVSRKGLGANTSTWWYWSWLIFSFRPKALSRSEL
jgi:plasmid stabilization system protein ParE